METVELDLPRVPVSVSRARAALGPLRAALGNHYQDTVLLVSELVTNAVRHGRGATLHLTAQVRAGACRVEVVDGGAGFEAPRGPVDVEASGGRGLRLVENLADAWGVYESHSTHVWFELDLDR